MIRNWAITFSSNPETPLILSYLCAIDKLY